MASLPLLGYTVSTPEEADGIHKEYVFKLQFKSHVYFFRAESEYTFERYPLLRDTPTQRHPHTERPPTERHPHTETPPHRDTLLRDTP